VLVEAERRIRLLYEHRLKHRLIPNRQRAWDAGERCLVRVFSFKMPTAVTMGVCAGVVLESGDWQQIILIPGIYTCFEKDYTVW